MKWTIDTAHSAVEFSVKHMMVSTAKGRFTQFNGEVFFDDANPHLTEIDVTIQTSSVDTHDEKRDGHLKSAEFFDAATYPTMTFKSTKVEQLDKENYRVTGDFTLHGVTKPVVLEVEHAGVNKNPWGVTVAGFSAKTSINRKDFGLNWNVALEAGGMLVAEKVNINLEVELNPAQVPATAQ